MNLSQGSTEQAAEVEALAGHTGEFSENVQRIAQDARQISSLSKEVEEGLLLSNTRMHNMAEVIQKISDKSSEINKIVKTIGHIAFITWRKSSKRSATNQARSTRLGRPSTILLSRPISLP